MGRYNLAFGFSHIGLQWRQTHTTLQWRQTLQLMW